MSITYAMGTIILLIIGLATALILYTKYSKMSKCVRIIAFSVIGICVIGFFTDIVVQIFHGI